jgi:hypothetical protein
LYFSSRGFFANELLQFSIFRISQILKVENASAAIGAKARTTKKLCTMIAALRFERMRVRREMIYQQSMVALREHEVSACPGR